MEKIGRRPSSDPAQEKLRQEKALWNKDVSTFINDLINFKKTMNGAPSKFFQEKSSIKEPIPADPVTIIGVLAGDFQEIAQKGNVIINEQIDYSKNRRKSKPKTVENPVMETPPPPDLAKQLSAWENKYELVAEGSNPISRFFTRLLTPTIGTSEAARIRKYRMSLLKACVATYKDLGKLQVEIVKSSKESINNSNKILHQAWDDWMLVNRGFNTYKSNMPKEVVDSGGVIPPSKDLEKDLEGKNEMKGGTPSTPIPGDYNYIPPEGEPLEIYEEKPEATKPPLDLKEKEYNFLAESIIKDYKNATAKGLFEGDFSLFNKLNSLIGSYLMAEQVKKDLIAYDLWAEYRKLLLILNQKYGTYGQSFVDIAKMRTTPKNIVAPKTASDQLEVLSQAFLKKWLGKTRHQMSLFDKTSAYRLDIFKMSKELRKILDQIMDSFQKEMNVEELNPLIADVNKRMSSLRGLMRALHMAAPKLPKDKNKNPWEAFPSTGLF